MSAKMSQKPRSTNFKRSASNTLPARFQPRIIAGKYKNRTLLVPQSSRPITDRIKQSMFDTLSEVLVDAQVLDLFAGSGSIGIEALSRGAAHSDFVELDRDAYVLLQQNLEKICDAETDWQTFNMTEKKLRLQLKKGSSEKQYDIIFADPPFPHAHKFRPDEWAGALVKDGILVVRMPASYDGPRHAKKFTELHRQTFGESVVTYYRMRED
jgi:16S rRNA (guanine966-N2)-methyltransferase